MVHIYFIMRDRPTPVNRSIWTCRRSNDLIYAANLQMSRATVNTAERNDHYCSGFCATRCDWPVATTNFEFARTLTTTVFERAYIGNKSLPDSIFESTRRSLSWSDQQNTNVLASLNASVHCQLLGVSGKSQDLKQKLANVGITCVIVKRYRLQNSRPITTKMSSKLEMPIQPRRFTATGY